MCLRKPKIIRLLQQCKGVLFLYMLRLCTSKWMICEIRRTVLLAFINCLVISTPQLKERNRLRNEFIGEFLTPDFLYRLLRQSDWLAWEFIENHNMLALRRKLFALRYFWCNVWVASILGSYRPNSGRWSRPVAIHPFSEPCDRWQTSLWCRNTLKYSKYSEYFEPVGGVKGEGVCLNKSPRPTPISPDGENLNNFAPIHIYISKLCKIQMRLKHVIVMRNPRIDFCINKKSSESTNQPFC